MPLNQNNTFLVKANSGGVGTYQIQNMQDRQLLVHTRSKVARDPNLSDEENVGTSFILNPRCVATVQLTNKEYIFVRSQSTVEGVRRFMIQKIAV